MTVGRTRRPAVITAAVALALAMSGFAVGALLDRGPLLPPRTSQARAMLPVIDAYLNSRAFQTSPDSGIQPDDGYLASSYPHLRSGWFCDAALIEIRPDRKGWRVGTDVYCIEYARRGPALLEGAGGDNGYYVMSLTASDGRYQVRSSTGGQPVVPDPKWVRRHFSPRVAAELNAGQGPSAPLPASLARHAFGLPPRAPVKPG